MLDEDHVNLKRQLGGNDSELTDKDVIWMSPSEKALSTTDMLAAG